MFLVKPSHEILTPVGIHLLKLIEAAGRTCYKSEDKITDDSAIDFCSMVIKRGHHSVIEHANITVRVICDRGVSHEIVRHRLMAISQESTRYCNYKREVTFVIPPWIDMEEGEYIPGCILPGPLNVEHAEWFGSMMNSEYGYLNLLEQGWSPQQARSVLPNSLKTELVLTANVREWRHIFTLRTSKAAHPQMRELMIPLLGELYGRTPVLFDDIYEELDQ